MKRDIEAKKKKNGKNIEVYTEADTIRKRGVEREMKARDTKKRWKVKRRDEERKRKRDKQREKGARCREK